MDGGILTRVDNHGALLYADWRIQTVGPGRPCLVCLDALRREDIALDQAGLLDDPTDIEGLGSTFNPLRARQNVFPFSLSVAAHEVLQMVGLVTGKQRDRRHRPADLPLLPRDHESGHDRVLRKGLRVRGPDGISKDARRQYRHRPAALGRLKWQDNPTIIAEPWTPQHDAALRRLAKHNTPTGLIAHKLGRTEDAVQSHASELDISLKPVNQSPYNRRNGN